MISHLDVNLIGGQALRPRPTFVNHLDKFFGDVHAPFVGPTVFEPLREFVGGIMIQNIDIEFALTGQTSKGQVAGPEKPGNGATRISSEAEVQLGVKRVAKKEFYNHLLRLQLRRQTAKTSLILISWRTEGKLCPKFLGQPPL